MVARKVIVSKDHGRAPEVSRDSYKPRLQDEPLRVNIKVNVWGQSPRRSISQRAKKLERQGLGQSPRRSTGQRINKLESQGPRPEPQAVNWLKG